MNERTSLRSRLALGLVALVAALLSAEGVLRCVQPGRLLAHNPRVIVEEEGAPEAAAVGDPLLGPALAASVEPWGYGLRPGLRARLVSSEFDVVLDTNELGLRGPELEADPPRRILGLGDSFAMGFGVEWDQTYLTLLASGAEPVNAGVLGYNPYNSANWLEGRGLELRPDLVVFQLWVGDDLCGPVEPVRLPTRNELDLVQRARFALRHSQLLVLTRELLRGIAPARRWLLGRGWIARFGADALLRADFDERCAAPLAALGEQLAESQRLVREAGARLVVLSIPLREQVYPADWERAAAYDGIPLDPAWLDFDAPSRALRALTAAHDLPLIDPLEALRARADGERLYFAGRDPHLTPAGHRVVAEALERFLAEAQPGGGE